MAWFLRSPAAPSLGGPSAARDSAPLASLSAAAERVAAAVVCIDVTGDNKEDPLQASADPHARGHGSGVILNESGTVLTNNHVIKTAKKLEVTLPGEETGYPAHVVGTDPLTDLAVVQMENLEKGRKLPFLEFGDSDAMKVGEWVIAVGNPYGVGHTVTIGVLSGKGKRLPGEAMLTDVLQTDAAINPGNSGGPLTNSQAQVIGINTAIVPFAQGIGFAVPSHTASWVARRLQEKGKVIRPYVGVELGRLTSEKRELLEVPQGSEGIVVRSVMSLSPAARAGLAEGDVILTNLSPDAFTAEVAQKEPGQTLKLDVWRQGEKKSFALKLAEMPAELPTGR